MFLANLFTLLDLGVFENFPKPGIHWDWSNTFAVTFAGFFIVFIVLLILIVVFSVFGKIMKKVNEKEAAKQPEQPAQPAPLAEGEVDDETAAVIVAAITEASGGKQVIIKEIKEAK